ncbi:hypothetical protein UABAM_05549 [Candidatus Uabimicrobium amorphum]|uniref:Glycine zipper domain-containing protein n=1 Tax=Uabimicrobium amorphum TaxID=2596890 RepID=A0A5S9IT51_UABAM|nr:hypothetical protein UABAM_05549 [Candidatus Uabimicrobium amorphum]
MGLYEAFGDNPYSYSDPQGKWFSAIAIAGTVVGAVQGAIHGGVSGALVGAAGGAIIGTTGNMIKAIEKRKNWFLLIAVDNDE